MRTEFCKFLWPPPINSKLRKKSCVRKAVRNTGARMWCNVQTKVSCLINLSGKECDLCMQNRFSSSEKQISHRLVCFEDCERIEVMTSHLSVFAKEPFG